MASRPALHTDVYDAISPEALAGSSKGKVAVVTGAAQGIGKAIAESLARAGADLALIDFDANRQAQTRADCERHGANVFSYGCDITDVEACRGVFGRIAEDLGPVEILVNNAGKNFRRPSAMETFEQYWRGIEVNLKGAMICIYQVIPGMRERGHGCVINVASRAGTVSVPFTGAYAAAKSALIRATACWQAEMELDGFGDSIHFYALHPGGVKTNMTLPVDDDVKAAYPEMANVWASFHTLFKTSPEVPAGICAFLAAGHGKALRGKYFDCEQDINTVIAGGRKALDGLYELKVEFAGGLPNDGGTAPSIVEQKD
ncbi:hypothetical protein EDB80DRAFT_883760 [Ilyonectria destructans]|nr:hypothetical protein EDB80DRAFT_883760 [Ilyonectria destructans]